MVKVVFAWSLTLVIHLGITWFLYWFGVETFKKIMPDVIAPIAILMLHLLLIGVWNGCPLTYLVDQHILKLFGIEYNLETYSASEMWIVRLFNWIFK